MIDFVKGRIVHIDVDYIVVEVNGIGYRLFCSNPQYFSGVEEEQTIYTHHHVREDAILLYGFVSREEQALFRRLIEVSGIGPRVAIGILSGTDPKTLVSAIVTENISYLTKLPGVGKKTAQRLILDLKDKLKSFVDHYGDDRDLIQQSDSAIPGTSLESSGMVSTMEMHLLEAKEGLMGLGYTESECDQVINEVRTKVQENDSVDTIIRLALQMLYKGM